MQAIKHIQNSDSQYEMHPAGEGAERVPMHPDDFKAHLAWVIAKRLHELIVKETCPEKTIYRRIIG